MSRPETANAFRKITLEEFLARLPDHHRDLYADVFRALPGTYLLSRKGIARRRNGNSYGRPPEPFCSPFRVKALVRAPSTGHWSRVVELLDPAGALVECVVPEGKLTGRPREAIGLLSDHGLRVFDEYEIRTILDLVRNWDVPSGARLQLIDRVGWTPDRDAFILPGGRVVMRPGATPKYRYGGARDGKETGSLTLWRDRLALLAVGNPNLVVAIALGFSTALMAFTPLDSPIFHFFGRTSRGKTRVLRAALTVWPSTGARERTWSGTVNGLEGEIAKSHGVLVGLDELREDTTPDLPAIIYRLANGSGKARGRKEGGTHDRASWSTAVLSTGELSFVETLGKLGVPVSGGQGVRMLDIPAEGAHGAFDALHGFETGDAFVAHLDKTVRTASGPAGAAFVEQLLRLEADALETALGTAMEARERELLQHLGVVAGDGRTAEIRRVIRTLALVATAGEWATRWGLTGWEPGTASEAVRIIAMRWLRERGRMPLDQIREIEKLRDYLAANASRFVALSAARAASAAAEAPPGYCDDAFFHVLPATLAGLSGGKAGAGSVLNALADGGYLERGGEDGSLQVRLPSLVPGRPRVYRIRRSILDFDGNPETAPAPGREPEAA